MARMARSSDSRRSRRAVSGPRGRPRRWPGSPPSRRTSRRLLQPVSIETMSPALQRAAVGDAVHDLLVDAGTDDRRERRLSLDRAGIAQEQGSGVVLAKDRRRRRLPCRRWSRPARPSGGPRSRALATTRPASRISAISRGLLSLITGRGGAAPSRPPVRRPTPRQRTRGERAGGPCLGGNTRRSTSSATFPGRHRVAGRHRIQIAPVTQGDRVSPPKADGRQGRPGRPRLCPRPSLPVHQSRSNSASPGGCRSSAPGRGRR